MATDVDVAVIGGGVAGLASALSLAEHGARCVSSNASRGPDAG